MKEDPQAAAKIPFKMQIYPTIATYVPNTGTFDLVPFTVSFDPEEMEAALDELLESGSNLVQKNEISKFLQLDSAFYDKETFSHYNVLLLRKNYKTPRIFQKAAICNMRFANFGIADVTDKKKILSSLSGDLSKNVLISYVRYNEKLKKNHTVEEVQIKNDDLDLFMKAISQHTILGKNQHNNFRTLLRQLRKAVHR